MAACHNTEELNPKNDMSHCCVKPSPCAYVSCCTWRWEIMEQPAKITPPFLDNSYCTSPRLNSYFRTLLLYTALFQRQASTIFIQLPSLHYFWVTQKNILNCHAKSISSLYLCYSERKYIGRNQFRTHISVHTSLMQQSDEWKFEMGATLGWLGDYL